MESSTFCCFLTNTTHIDARNLERIKRIDKNISPDILLVTKKKRTKDDNI